MRRGNALHTIGFARAPASSLTICSVCLKTVCFKAVCLKTACFKTFKFLGVRGRAYMGRGVRAPLRMRLGPGAGLFVALGTSTRRHPRVSKRKPTCAEVNEIRRPALALLRTSCMYSFSRRLNLAKTLRSFTRCIS
ncbi:hypothetical protein C8Q79DRAFT_355944 [Trametes meyenii]|nr:hypothetical protein C8Q79DRAFT_355944 [Trametes meyenii]